MARLYCGDPTGQSGFGAGVQRPGCFIAPLIQFFSLMASRACWSFRSKMFMVLLLLFYVCVGYFLHGPFGITHISSPYRLMVGINLSKNCGSS